MKYIRVSEDGLVLEISPVPEDKNIFDYYVEGIASQFIKVDAPDNLEHGWFYSNGTFTPPAPQIISPEPVIESIAEPTTSGELIP